MPIEKGEEWGRHALLPADGVVVHSDAAARAIVEQARRDKAPLPPIGLAGGDLCRTLGGTGDERRLRSEAAMAFDVDLGSALVDGRLVFFLAHLVARARTWTRAVAAMNAEFLGAWDVAPRAHPGDGLLDVIDADLVLSDLLPIRARLRTGTHLPHPRIRVRRTGAAQFDLPRRLAVRVDGVALGTAHTLSIRVEPAAVTVYV
jgi:hypothetical protein